MGDFIELNGTYTYKGRDYKVTGYDKGKLLVKDATSGNWSDAVQYTGLGGEGASMTFVRAAEDFTTKFERIDG